MTMEQDLVNASAIIQVFSIHSRWLNGNVKLTWIVGSILEGQRCVKLVQEQQFTVIVLNLQCASHGVI